ncbi:MAG: TlpA family protein disulfide reductase [Planctomycetota bacterium]|jgi:hypothetical protein
MLKPCLLGAIAIVATAGPVLADETYEQLVAEFNAARHDWYAKIQKMQEEGRFDMSNVPTPPEMEYVPKFRAFADRHAGSPRAVPALSWLVSNAADSEEGPRALRTLRDQHADDSQLAELMQTLHYVSWSLGRQPIVEFCERVRAVNEHDAARAGGTYVLAVALQDGMVQGPGADPERAEQLFRSLVKEHPDTEFARKADRYLFEIDHLQVGMKAPHIEGSSPTGEAIKLSQFEGQVVVLDFWGFW